MMKMPPPDAYFVAVDTETTGLDPSIERIKSIGAAGGTMRDGMTKGLSRYVDTEGRRSSPESFEIHRIPDDVEGAIHERDALLELDDVIGDGTVVMQNKSFDIGFLTAAYQRQQLQIPKWLQDFGTAIIDTIELGKEKYPGRQLNLDNLARLTGVERHMIERRVDKHDVLEDCELTLEVFRRLVTPTTLDLVGERSREEKVDANTIKNEEATLDWL